MTKIFIFFLFLLTLLASSAQKQKQVYIVHFGGSDNGEKALHEIQETHHSYLLSVKDNEEEARASHLYSYKHSINGFSAVLTPDEAARLSELEEVVSVYPSHPEKYSLQTTRSWEFVGLDEVAKQNWNHFNMGQDLLSKARYGQDVIVGLVDNGVWPESKSFSDEGMGPVPKSWKGICQTGVAFNSSLCNKWPWPPLSWTFSELPKRPFSVTAFTFGLLCDCIAKVIPLVVRFLCVRIRRQRSN